MSALRVYKYTRRYDRKREYEHAHAQLQLSRRLVAPRVRDSFIFLFINVLYTGGYVCVCVRARRLGTFSVRQQRFFCHARSDLYAELYTFIFIFFSSLHISVLLTTTVILKLGPMNYQFITASEPRPISSRWGGGGGD